MGPMNPKTRTRLGTCKRALALALPLALAALASLTAASALAVPCNPDVNPDCGASGGGPTNTSITTHLTVTAPSTGSITSSPAGINCGSDCSEGYSYNQSCDEGDCTNSGVDAVTLSASGGPSGYTAQLYRCDSNATGTTCTSETFCGNNTCDLTMDQNLRARAVWVDTTAPTAPTSVSGPTKVGPSAKHFSASGATDNSGSVSSYHYYLDGVSQGLSSTGYDVPVDSLSEGSHTIAASARDASGNESASQTTAGFTVDKSAAVGAGTPPSVTSTAPSITFTTDSDVHSDGATCTTRQGTTTTGQTTSCGSPYTAQVSGDGDYTVSFQVTDDVGNTATTTRSFTYDTTGPSLTVNSPSDGDVKTQGFTPSITSSDPHGTSVQCRIDSAAYGACGPQTGSAGPHTFWARSTDDVGNSTERSVNFSFAETGGGGQQTTPIGPTISDAVIGDKLVSDLKNGVKKLAKQKQKGLAKKGKYSLAVHALMGGKFTLSLKGAAGKAKAARSTTIATGSKTVSGPGTYKVTLKLTKAGKKLLRKGRRVKGKLALSFVKSGGGKVGRSKNVTFKRR
jgi:hypothetical protein